MSHDEIRIAGILQPDGTVVLDERPKMTPGRITVILRQESMPQLPQDDPFWQRMQGIWTEQIRGGHAPRSDDEIATEKRQLDDEWEERQRALEQIQGNHSDLP